MTAPAWYNDGKKLIEGETYMFHFIKVIPLSDNMNYMLMEDPFGIRHLVPYEYYIQYKLEPGNRINCRVDKINCTGRVFLEPEHPYYKTGLTAKFTLLSVQAVDDSEALFNLMVEDAFGNEIHLEKVQKNAMDFEAGHLICLVEGFKKGKPILSIASPTL